MLAYRPHAQNWARKSTAPPLDATREASAWPWAVLLRPGEAAAPCIKASPVEGLSRSGLQRILGVRIAIGQRHEHVLQIGILGGDVPDLQALGADRRQHLFDAGLAR